MPELMKLLRTKSIIRYFPPKGTAGLARSLVKGKRRVPLPPASTMPRTRMRIDFQPRLIFSGNCGSGKRKIIKTSGPGPIRNPRVFDNRNMLPILGILIVFGAVVAGYVMEH